MTTAQQERIAARRIPEGYQPMFIGKYASCYVSEDGLIAKFFKGTSQKPVFWARFHKEEDLKKTVNDTLNRILSWEEMKCARKIQRKTALTNIKVGDMLHYSWGYEQTNCEFYQVIECNGKSMKIRQIAGKSCGGEGGSSMSDRLMPMQDAFLANAPVLTKTSLSMGHGSLDLVEVGKSYYSSWYA